MSVGETKAGLARVEVLSLHLLDIERIFIGVRTRVLPDKKEKRLSM